MDAEAKRAAEQVGDLWVVMCYEGMYWDGSKWVRFWRDARQFPSGGAAYADCVAEAARTERETGLVAFARYVRPRNRRPPVK